jgi:hypothetical protein
MVIDANVSTVWAGGYTVRDSKRIVRSGERADAEFIANAREDIPALIAEVERLRTGLVEAYDALRCGEKDKGGQVIEDLLKGGAR